MTAKTIKTLLFGLGALGALGASGYATRGFRRMRARKQLERELAEYDEPVIITEEAVIISEPYDALDALR